MFLNDSIYGSVKGEKSYSLSQPPKTVYVSSSQLRFCVKTLNLKNDCWWWECCCLCLVCMAKGFNGTTELKWFN